MAACVVCNQQTTPDDLQDVGDMTSICTRLEQVLDEAVPEEAVICSSCQFDLTQIEMYYTLLTIFKKRYLETAKLRLESQTHETRRNILHETASSPSYMQSLSGARKLPDNSSTHLPLQSDAFNVCGGSETSSPVVKLEVHDVRMVKDEMPGDESAPVEITNLTNIEGDEPEIKSENIQELSPHTNTLTDSNSEPTIKERGRPKKNEQHLVVSMSSFSGRKSGGPRKNKQQIATKRLKKTPREDGTSVVAQTRGPTVNKGGQSRNTEQTRKSRPVFYEESELEEHSVEEKDTGETETDDPISSEYVKRALENKTGDSETENYKAKTSTDGETTAKKKHRGSKKERDPSYVAAMVQKKRGKPKKTKDPHPTYPCTLCDNTFSSRPKLKAHMKTHTSYRPFVCSVCSKEFTHVGLLNAHMKYHVADRPFKCDTCGKGFLRKILLERHLMVHSDIRPFQCDQCEKKFKCPQHLQVHVKCHHEDGKKYLCNVCGRALFTVGSLRSHMKTHSTARPFKCETCGRDFPTKAYLVNHELTHQADTREKYLCPICGKELLNKSYLPSHMRLHTGESKHRCALCDKSFSTSSTYKRHMLIHSGEKPHRCSECGKGFAGMGNLTVHMMSHTGERPYTCKCGQGFRSKSKMRRHIQTSQHGECGEKSVDSESLNRSVAHSTSVAASAPVAALCTTVAPAPAPCPVVVPPPPVLPPHTLPDQHELMSAYQAGPVYPGL